MTAMMTLLFDIYVNPVSAGCFDYQMPTLSLILELHISESPLIGPDV